MRLLWRPRALEDVREIFAFIATRDPGSAKAYTDRIFTAAMRLERHPHSGRARDEVGEGLRSIRSRSHVIFYFVAEDEIHVLRIVHAARDIRRLADEISD
ncbi:MAG: type II toxin-antitoxin system RelE/ParE family toxin [Alphaproteobacteria bacterium]|nr:type II toxin-antitoxin system RelE/ParE family toxin [Alphaproteobacteria bacterium]